MRACQPSRDGYVERDGVKLHYEVYGAGEPTVMPLPSSGSAVTAVQWPIQTGPPTWPSGCGGRCW
jgi:hypothetical protein